MTTTRAYPAQPSNPFAAAVATAAAKLPHVTSATPNSESGWYSVRFSTGKGLAIHTESARTAKEAVALFVEAATDTTPLQVAAPIAYTDSRITGASAEIKELLGLTPNEVTTYSVFVLSSDFRPEDDEATTARAAVCLPIAREHWAALTPGQIILYTELYRFPEDDENPAGTTALVTHCGPLRIYDAWRGLLYAGSWRGADNEFALAGDEVQEVWVVQRFIERPA
jgi:hypothetical protein